MVIKGYDFAWKVVVEYQDVDAVQGMAWGVKADITNGKRGLIPNWCAYPASDTHNVSTWEVTE